MSKSNYIGIDLGTTFSAIAHVNEHGVPEIVENTEGERTTPSVVLFDGHEITVGSYAKENIVAYPGQVVEFVKRHMGETHFNFEYDNRKYTASEVSAFILRKLKEDAEAKLGEPVQDVVITVPAYFGDPQRRATIEAGEQAGLKVLQLINEPTAAAYAYGLHQLGKDQRVLVFDLGGGTFDVTVMEISGGQIVVKATDGDHQLGGRHWDDSLVQYLAGQFEKQFGFSPLSDEVDYQTLKEKALAAKISLSSLPKVNVIFGCHGKTMKEEIRRGSFEEITTSLLEQCELLTARVLSASGNKKSDIDVVLLAGGSTRMPMVNTMLKNYFGKEPSKALNPDECVAMGAALKAALLKKETWALPGKQKIWGLPGKFKDINVTSHSFGLVVFKDEELYNSIVIPKNTPYPVDVSRSDYVTSNDGQETLDLHVLEGEAEDPRDCDLVGSYQIYNIPSRPAGKTRLKVTYKYNESQIIEVAAMDVKNGSNLPLQKIANVDLDQLVCARGTDVALLIDCSGSMAGSKIDDAKRAAISFLKSFRVANGSVGLIGFPGGIIHKLTRDISSIKSEIHKLRADNGTPMTTAIDLAHKSMLIESGIDRVVVLLSDGAPDNASSAEAAAKLAKEKDIRIITVGVSGADEDFLKRIASSPKDYHFCNQSLELESTFINIATQLASGSSLRAH